MKEKLRNFRKEVFVTILAVMLFAATFVGCEFVHQTCAWMRRGNELGTAMSYAAENVSERLDKVYAAWFPERDDGIKVYPIVNANISWNCLNKK